MTAEPRLPPERPPSRRLRVGIVGCGDVAHRRYLPALADLAEKVEVVRRCDPSGDEAARAAASVEGSAATAYTEIDRLMADARPDAIFNLTLAPAHGAELGRVGGRRPVARDSDHVLNVSRR